MTPISLCHLSSIQYLSTCPVETGNVLPRVQLKKEIKGDDETWHVESTKNGAVRLRHAKHHVYFGAQEMRSSNSPIDPCTKYIPIVTNQPDPHKTEWIFQLELGTDRLRLLHRDSNQFLRAHRYEYDGHWRLELVSDSSDPETEWVRTSSESLPDEDSGVFEVPSNEKTILWTLAFVFFACSAYLQYATTS